MRNIETYHYSDGKEFTCGELTVKQYELFIKDPERAIIEVLLEFNDNAPQLSQEEMETFIKSLLSFSDGKKGTGKGFSQDDFHILKGIFLHNFPQPWDIFHEKVTVREMFLFLEDLPIILGQKEYDPMRKSERIDGASIRELQGEIGG